MIKLNFPCSIAGDFPDFPLPIGAYHVLVKIVKIVIVICAFVELNLKMAKQMSIKSNWISQMFCCKLQ